MGGACFAEYSLGEANFMHLYWYFGSKKQLARANFATQKSRFRKDAAIWTEKIEFKPLESLSAFDLLKFVIADKGNSMPS